eukprot:scaffold108380_cov39-Cyclotella_meneghiniana.AAC.1
MRQSVSDEWRHSRLCSCAKRNSGFIFDRRADFRKSCLAHECKQQQYDSNAAVLNHRIRRESCPDASRRTQHPWR